MNSKKKNLKKFRILFIGNSGVGKSTIIKSFRDSNPLEEKIEKTESIKVDEFLVSDDFALVLTDTPGANIKESSSGYTHLYFCKIICLVFRGTTNKLFYPKDIDYLNSWISYNKIKLRETEQKIIIVRNTFEKDVDVEELTDKNYTNKLKKLVENIPKNSLVYNKGKNGELKSYFDVSDENSFRDLRNLIFETIKIIEHSIERNEKLERMYRTVKNPFCPWCICY